MNPVTARAPGHAHAHRLGLIALLAATAVLAGCATTSPVLVSKKLEPVPMNERTRADIAQCSQAADQRVGRNGLNAEGAARQSASTAGVGFVGAAAGGLAARSRDVWQRARGAAAGGATAMLTKLFLEWNEGDEVYQGYVERCLEARGHEVLGWR